jgi:hypothetical protein
MGNPDSRAERVVVMERVSTSSRVYEYESSIPARTE